MRKRPVQRRENRVLLPLAQARGSVLGFDLDPELATPLDEIEF